VGKRQGQQVISPTRQPSAWAYAELHRAYQILDGDADEATLLRALAMLDGAQIVGATGPDLRVLGMLHAARAEVFAQLARDADDLDRVVAERTAAVALLRHRDPGQYVTCLIALAEGYRDRVNDVPWRNAEKVVSLFRAATVRARRRGDTVTWARATYYLGVAYSERLVGDERRNQRRAIRAFRTAATAFAQLGDRPRWARCYSSLAETYLNVEDYDRAIVAARTALTGFTRRKDPFERAVALSLLGAAFTRRDDPEGASYDRGLRLMGRARRVIASSDRGDARNAEAALLIGLSNAYLRRARARGPAAGKGDAALAADFLARALAVYTELARPEQCRTIALDLGLIHARQLGDWAAAASAWESAARAHQAVLDLSLDQVTRKLTAAEGQLIASLLAYSLVACGRPEEAAVALERGRGTVARSTLESSRLPSDAGDIDRTNATPIPADIDRTSATPIPADGWPTSRFKSALTRIRSLMPGFLRPIEFSDLLPAGPGVTVAYVTVTEFGSVWILLTDGAPPQVVPAAMRLAELNAFLKGDGLTGYVHGQFLGLGDFPDALEECLERLDDLTGPVMAAVEELGTRELVLVPTGRANLLPLHLKLAAADLTVSYVPSALLLRTARANAAIGREPSLLAVAVPDGDPPLPYAEIEVRQAAALFPEATILLQDEADVMAAAERASHVHFACHGYADVSRPLASYLELPGGRRLYVAELLDHSDRLRGTRVAVLSACQTALAFDQPDEWLALPTAFLVAGVAGVVASLWPVDDLATAILMSRFYDHLLGGAAPAEALREAQRDLADTTSGQVLAFLGREQPAGTHQQRPFAHAADWGGFVYIGV
jgi:tetratricopeptide (TPR) repeat protein